MNVFLVVAARTSVPSQFRAIKIAEVTADAHQVAEIAVVTAESAAIG